MARRGPHGASRRRHPHPGPTHDSRFRKKKSGRGALPQRWQRWRVTTPTNAALPELRSFLNQPAFACWASCFTSTPRNFARIEGIGHAIHGDRSRKRRGVGWEVVLVCIDDCTRARLRGGSPGGERRACCDASSRRALRWFERQGIHAKRILSDNAKCYASKVFTARVPSRTGYGRASRGPTRPAPTARPNASSRPSSAAGPIATRTAPQRSEPPRSDPGSTS